MPVGLHLMMMQTQVPRFSIQNVVDPAEHSIVSDPASASSSDSSPDSALDFDLANDVID
uniref:Late blight resistance protein n=1 Tax=Solanum tuberosum TaxID=4113 RepID=M1DSP5_SOLTU